MRTLLLGSFLAGVLLSAYGLHRTRTILQAIGPRYEAGTISGRIHPELQVKEAHVVMSSLNRANPFCVNMHWQGMHNEHLRLKPRKTDVELPVRSGVGRYEVNLRSIRHAVGGICGRVPETLKLLVQHQRIDRQQVIQIPLRGVRGKDLVRMSCRSVTMAGERFLDCEDVTTGAHVAKAPIAPVIPVSPKADAFPGQVDIELPR